MSSTMALSHLPTPADWKYVANLLRIGLGHGNKALPSAERTLTEYAEALMASQSGRDFTLIAQDHDHGDVEFEIHPAVAIGRSDVLHNHMYPEQSKKLVNDFFKIPSRFTPVMVDRMVNHMYKGTYKLDRGNKLTLLHHATKTAVKSDEAYANKQHYGLNAHLRIYDMAEWFEYTPLMHTAYARMVDNLLRTPVTLPALLNLVSQTYCPVEKRVCKDEDGALRRLVVVAAVVASKKHWSAEEQQAFNTVMQLNKEFLEAWDSVGVELDVLNMELEEGKEDGKKKKRRITYL